jgi:hypothetical protein
MAEIKEVELSLLKSIINGNLEKFSFLLEHLGDIKIKSREATGIGLNITFEYLKDVQEEEEFTNGLLSTELKLTTPSLKNELTYCLDITNGKIDFLEIITNGNEIWDGNLENCSLN